LIERAKTVGFSSNGAMIREQLVALGQQRPNASDPPVHRKTCDSPNLPSSVCRSAKQCALPILSADWGIALTVPERISEPLHPERADQCEPVGCGLVTV